MYKYSQIMSTPEPTCGHDSALPRSLPFAPKMFFWDWIEMEPFIYLGIYSASFILNNTFIDVQKQKLQSTCILCSIHIKHICIPSKHSSFFIVRKIPMPLFCPFEIQHILDILGPWQCSGTPKLLVAPPIRLSSPSCPSTLPELWQLPFYFQLQWEQLSILHMNEIMQYCLSVIGLFHLT